MCCILYGLCHISNNEEKRLKKLSLATPDSTKSSIVDNLIISNNKEKNELELIQDDCKKTSVLGDLITK